MNTTLVHVTNIAGDASVHLLDCVADDRPEMRDYVRTLELAAQMHREADELERIVRAAIKRDMTENTRHEQALKMLRQIAAIECQELEKTNRPLVESGRP